MKSKNSIVFILLAFIITISCFSKITFSKVLAKNNENNIECLSKSAYLCDANTGTVIYSKNENMHLPIASMCKIMTLLLIFEEIDCGNISLEDDIEVSCNASGMGGSQIFLEPNVSYKAEELIKGIVIASANDACVAFAEKIAGSESAFVDLMNKKAEELQMKDTNFVNCTGLPRLGQYSCAKDVSTMFRELIKHKNYFKYSTIWMDEISHPNNRITQISNTNKLIKFYNGCDSGKTGYTAEAGHCLCSSAVRDGTRIVSVVISAPDSKTRFKEVSNMFNYAFANFITKTIVDNTKPLEESCYVKNGKKENLEIVAEKPVYIFSKKNQKRSFELQFIQNNVILSPVEKGQVVGKLYIYENSVCIYEVNVLANESVDRKSYFDNVYDVVENWQI
ncbi:MAG: D-alanyl-D-alanine carboxypeptidase [Clostridia bacterium]|nr:D-alanyl-D-alanine carboxypeptidase [Clostridia bacterium]